MAIKNNEGRTPLTLPSGRKAILRPYDAYAADAIGDVALQEEGTEFDKALSSIVEAVDTEKMISFEEDRGAAIQAARALHLNDYHHIIFMAVASFRDGFFSGDIPDDSGGTFKGSVQLLNEDGTPIEHFEPPPYPLGTDTSHEWEEDIKELDGKSVKFKLKILTGQSRAKMLEEGVTNLNMDLISRAPAWFDETKGIWIPYNPKARPPSWAARILSRKAKEIDPVIQYTAKFKNKGKTVIRSIFGIPDFFLQDFT